MTESFGNELDDELEEGDNHVVDDVGNNDNGLIFSSNAALLIIIFEKFDTKKYGYKSENSFAYQCIIPFFDLIFTHHYLSTRLGKSHVTQRSMGELIILYTANHAIIATFEIKPPHTFSHRIKMNQNLNVSMIDGLFDLGIEYPCEVGIPVAEDEDDLFTSRIQLMSKKASVFQKYGQFHILNYIYCKNFMLSPLRLNILTNLLTQYNMKGTIILIKKTHSSNLLKVPYTTDSALLWHSQKEKTNSLIFYFYIPSLLIIRIVKWTSLFLHIPYFDALI
ncbi:hypothetical protein BDA99DRAFT_533079 [Phascolomyces articulosus]|uniref:Uncharacterized protein n=1 Tax=Phascolomyces articulosus TaxID=60185 RepID=A0AAD5K8S0_9FUNG|nr:hypothetical protein BDA99DRAFT_533079 [Phascolomyces articulosus]